MEYSESIELSENVVSTVSSIGDIALIVIAGSILLFLAASFLALAIAGVKWIAAMLIDNWDDL